MTPRVVIGPRTLLNDCDHSATAIFWRSAIPRCSSFRCKITVSLAQGAVHDAEADVADPVFVRSTICFHDAEADVADPVFVRSTINAYSQYPVICAPVICHVLCNWEDRDRQLPREPSTNLAIVFWNAAQTGGIGKT